MTSIAPTSVVEWTERRWKPEELEAAFAGTAAATTSRPSSGPSTTTADVDEASLPDELLAEIRNGGVARGNGAKGDKSRSGLFHYVIGELKKRRWPIEQIHTLLEKYPNGVAAKYRGRLADEIRRSYVKVENGNGAGNGASNGVGGPTGQHRRRLRQGPRPSSEALAAILEALERFNRRPRRPLLARLPGPPQGLRRERGPRRDMCCPPSGSSLDSCRA